MYPVKTPLLRHDFEACTLVIKDESAQPSGAFKLRGPTEYLARNPIASGQVTTASTGNHAIGLSMAAKAKGIDALIWVPDATPPSKLNLIKASGAQINLVKGDYEAALAAATEYAARTGAELVPSYDHPDIIAGNQHVFAEIDAQTGATPDMVVAPIGGGGILSAAINHYRGTSTHIVGVELAEYARTEQICSGAWAEAPRVTAELPTSLEGVAVRILGNIPTQIIRDADNLTVTSAPVTDLTNACRWLWDTHGVRAELGGCTALAAALRMARSDTPPPVIACVVTGGNIAPEDHARVLGL